MKKFLVILAALTASLAFISLQSCNSDDETTWEKYREWRDFNQTWLEELQLQKNADGTPYYSVIVPRWNNGAYVLVHWFNDTTETRGNLSPLYTSTVDVRYKLHLADGTPADSSDNITSYGEKGIFRSSLSSVIQGWPIAFEAMHCGDTVEIIVPYQSGYGTQNLGAILPYSNLRFNVRLVDIPYYEAAPYE